MRNLNLENKTAIVTGAAKGIGRSISLYLADQGCNVAVNYLTSEQEAQDLADQINGILLQADVTDSRQVENMMDKVLNQYGEIDILINNVGNFIYKPLLEVSPEEFDSIISNNLNSAFYCSQYTLSRMRGYGRIVNFGSSGCDRMIIRENTMPYYIAKTGVVMLTKALASETKTKEGDNITVNCISPGILENSDVKHDVPRYGTYDDIINALSFVLDPSSDYVNGANIEVSGGLSLDRD